MLPSALQHVERTLRQNNVPVETKEDAIIATATGRYPTVRYPFVISEHTEGGLYAILEIKKASVPIDRPGELAQVFCKSFEDISVYFDEEEDRFYLTIDFEPTKTHERLSRFLAACDVAFPVLAQVSEQGSWDSRLVNLALFDEDQFFKA